MQAEQIEVLRHLWCDEIVNYDGRFHHLKGVTIVPAPVQRPIPIWVGGSSDAAVKRFCYPTHSKTTRRAGENGKFGLLKGSGEGRHGQKAAIFEGLCAGFVFVRQCGDAESSADSVGAV